MTPDKHTLQAHTTGLTDGTMEVEVSEEGSALIVGSKSGMDGAASEAASGKGSKLSIEFWSADSTG